MKKLLARAFLSTIVKALYKVTAAVSILRLLYLRAAGESTVRLTDASL